MPQEQGYTRQTRPQAGVPLPGVSAESYGAGLGAAISGAAEDAHRDQLRGYAIERQRTQDAERTAGLERLTNWQTLVNELALDRRTNAAPGADGHMAAIEELLTEERQQALYEGVTEDSVRQWIRGQAANYIGAVRDREMAFAAVKGAGKVTEDAVLARDRLVNQAASSEDPNAWPDAVDTWRSYAEGLSGIDGDARNALLQEGFAAIDIGKARAIIRSDPGALIGFIDGGVFDDTLTPAQIQALRNEAEVEVRSRDVAAARELAGVAAATKEAVNTLIQRDQNGEIIPDEDFAAAEQAVAQLGDTSLAERIVGIRSDNAITRQYGPGNATPLQRQQAQAALAAIPPEQRTPEQSRALQSLQEKSPGWDAAFERDPVAALAVHGGMPEINFADPASLGRRGAWRRAQAAATGRFVPPISQAEAAPLAEMLEQGQEVQVLAALDGFADPFDRIDAAQVIDPEDKLFHRLAVMDARQRATVRRGAQALQANPKLLTPEDQFSTGATRMAKWERNLALALRAMDQDDAEAVRQSARLILAGSLARHPGVTIDNLAESDFAKAVQMALGRENRGDTHIGGLATWGGDAPFIVAPNYNAAGVRNALIRDRQAMDQKGLGPVNPDQSPADFRYAYPVWLGGRRYRWETPGGNVLRDKNGNTFISDLRR